MLTLKRRYQDKLSKLEELNDEVGSMVKEPHLYSKVSVKAAIRLRNVTYRELLALENKLPCNF